MEFVYHVSLNAKHVVIIVVVIHVFLDITDKPQTALFVNHLVQPALLYIHVLHV